MSVSQASAWPQDSWVVLEQPPISLNFSSFLVAWRFRPSHSHSFIQHVVTECLCAIRYLKCWRDTVNKGETPLPT